MSEFYDLSEKDTWQTPDEITDALQRHLDITLDPCAGLFTFIAAENWTIEVPDSIPDGLETAYTADEAYDTVIRDGGGRLLRCGGDSLEREWDTGGIAFVNPPFSMKGKFIEKALEEYNKGNIDGAIILTPDSTDVKSWWHGQLAPNTEYVWFSEGRISYINPETGELEKNPTFGTALHFIGNDGLWSDELFAELSEVGDVMRRLNY